MLENHYTTQMSNDKEKLKNRLENIQREPKKKHKAVGILVFLVLAAALTVGTLCLAAATNQDTAPAVTMMTDEELTAFLDQPWGAVMASLDYANEEILVFHYNEALCVLDLGNLSFRFIFDLSGLNLTTAAQGDVFLQVDVAQNGSKAYLSVGGMTYLAAAYDTYVVDLTTGQVEKGESPEGTDLFRSYQDTSTAIPDVTGWYDWRCITVGDKTYYLRTLGPLVQDLQLVTRYADGRPDKVWYLFGEPDILLDDTSGDLYTATEAYLAQEFHRVFDPYYDIQSLTITDWVQDGEEATFLYTMVYPKDAPQGDTEQMTFSMKVIRDQNKLTFYRDVGGIGGAEYDGPKWAPTDIQSFVLLP